jgi:hypothetical protein
MARREVEGEIPVVLGAGEEHEGKEKNMFGKGDVERNMNMA